MKKHEREWLELQIQARYIGRLFKGHTLSNAINPINEANWFVHYCRLDHAEIQQVAKDLKKRLQLEELLEK